MQGQLDRVPTWDKTIRLSSDTISSAKIRAASDDSRTGARFFWGDRSGVSNRLWHPRILLPENGFFLSISVQIKLSSVLASEKLSVWTRVFRCL
jgi:hypothetical protein